jgi:hypothetical protein
MHNRVSNTKHTAEQEPQNTQYQNNHQQFHSHYTQIQLRLNDLKILKHIQPSETPKHLITRNHMNLPFESFCLGQGKPPENHHGIAKNQFWKSPKNQPSSRQVSGRSLTSSLSWSRVARVAGQSTADERHRRMASNRRKSRRTSPLRPPNLSLESVGSRVLLGSAHGSWVQAPPIVDPPVESTGTRVAGVDPWRIGLPWVTGSPVLSPPPSGYLTPDLSVSL